MWPEPGSKVQWRSVEQQQLWPQTSSFSLFLINVFLKHCTLYKTHSPTSEEIHYNLRIFMNINKTFENDKVLVLLLEEPHAAAAQDKFNPMPTDGVSSARKQGPQLPIGSDFSIISSSSPCQPFITPTTSCSLLLATPSCVYHVSSHNVSTPAAQEPPGVHQRFCSRWSEVREDWWS